MACLHCGCDSSILTTWFDSCSCHCHTERNRTYSQLKKNQIHGKLAQLYSQQDFIDNGFSIIFAGDRGFDFVAYQTTSNQLLYLVEVKYNTSRLSKFQKLIQRYCKLNHINYFVYKVTKDQLQFWLNKGSNQ